MMPLEDRLNNKDAQEELEETNVARQRASWMPQMQKESVWAMKK